MEEWINLHTWIVWYCRDEASGRVEPLNKKDVKGTKRPTWSSRVKTTRKWMEERPFIEKSNETSPSIFQLPRSYDPSIYTGSLLNKAIQLQFWTVSVHFRCSYHGEAHDMVNLYDPNANQVGIAKLNELWEERLNETALHEFILLSGYIDPDGQDVPGHQNAARRPNEWNIMLVKWRQSLNEPFVAERAGVGILSHDGIDRAFKPGPLWKEIVLS